MSDPRRTIPEYGNLHEIKSQIKQTMPQIALEAMGRHGGTHIAQVEREGL